MTSKLTITRERIELIANFHRAMTLPPSHDEIEELARMALAAIDSEPVAWMHSNNDIGIPAITVSQKIGHYWMAEFENVQPLYRHAQPAPETEREPIAWLNDAYLARGVVDGEAGSEDAGPGYIPVYREASPAQPAPVVPEEKPMPNPLSMYAVDAVAAIAEAKGWNACRAAMLQHQPQNAQQNIPENIPGGLVEAVNNLLNNDGSRGCYDAMECGTAREKIELWLAQRQRWEEQRKANLSAGNSPVIPDGYVMVPKEPTQAMCAAFNDSDYGRKSLRERYVAMLAAAPQEVK